MNVPKILLIDQDPKNIRILRNNLMEAGYEVDASVTDAEAFEKISQQSFSAILTEIAAPGIDGYRILEQSQKTTFNRDSAIIFLTQKSDIWNRVKGFKLGAKDYIIKPIHVREIIARVQMIIARVNRHNEPGQKPRAHFTGTLADLGLVELVEAFGAERKTGVLSLYSENGASGRVYFKEGAVIGAVTGLHHTEEAIYKMMSWRKGRFSMLFAPVDMTDEIGVSNMGLLLQGAKRMEQREQLLKYLPALEAVLVTTANFKKIIAKKALASDLEYFVSLFDGERTLGRIIDESKYDEITTLQRIRKLYELGFLHTLRDFSATEAVQEEEDAVAEETPPGTRRFTQRSDVPQEPPMIQPIHPLPEEEETFPFESRWTSAGAEQLLSPEEEPVEPERALDPESEKEAIETRATAGPDVDMEEFDLLTPDLATLTGDTGLEKDLFYDLRHAEQEGRDLFTDSKELEGGALFPNLELLETKHPADALLNLGGEESDIVETQPEPPIPPAARQPVEREKPVPIFSDHDRDEEEDEIEKLEAETYLHERFKRAHGIILVLSNNSDLRRQFLSSLTSGQLLQKAAFMPQVSDLSLGTAEFKGGHLLNLVALSLRHEFAPIIDYFAKNLLGYVLLIDGRRIDWGYHRYLLQVLQEKMSIPSVIVFAYNDFLQQPQEEATIRAKLGLTERVKLQFINEWSVENTRRIIFRLFDMRANPQRARSTGAIRAERPNR